VGARGRLLVFEGAEGAGKTTQVERLAARLAAAGVPCERYREPGGTPLGDAVRALVLTPGGEVAPRAEALLFMAARAQLAARLRERLAGGVTVLLDRFFLSTYAYQIAGRGLPAAEVRAANRLATDGLVPDLTVLLAADPAVARARMVARGGLDRMEQEDAAFHARVADAFLAAADPAWQRAHAEVGPVALVDAGGPPEAVEARVWALLGARFAETFRVGPAAPETFRPGRESDTGR
jgi:dTMP kinase